MIRLQIALFVAGVLCLSASAQDNPTPKVEDPIAVELSKAKQEYQSAVEKAGEKLVAAFADQKKKLDENKKLRVEELIKLAEQLQAEEKAFAADATNLPKSPSMKTAVNDYQTSVGTARKKCEAAFVRAAESYRDKKDLTSAKVVLAEKDSFLSRGRDGFQAGSVWDGQITFRDGRKGAAVGRQFAYQFEVTHRSGDAVTVVSTQEKRNRTELKGTIRIDKVELKSTQNLSGNPFHPGTYTGQLRGTTLEMTFKLDQGNFGDISLKRVDAAERPKSISGDYKDNLGRDTSFTVDGKARFFAPAKKQFVTGTWVHREGKYEIPWNGGAIDIVEFDKNGKDLVGKAISPEKKEHPRTFTAVPKK